jgi:hypothetical protein
MENHPEKLPMENSKLPNHNTDREENLNKEKINIQKNELTLEGGRYDDLKKIRPLTYLDGLKSVFIKQEVEPLEILTGREIPNIYSVYMKDDTIGRPLFRCEEFRHWCGEFFIKVKDCISSPPDQGFFCFFERPSKCTCCCLGRPEMKGQFGLKAIPIGKMISPFTCYAKYDIYNYKNELRYIVSGDSCECELSTRGKWKSIDFPIYNPKKLNYTKENPDGCIKKIYKGKFQEKLTDADNYLITFPEDAVPEEKLMIIGTVIMMDYIMFENDNLKVRPRRPPRLLKAF